MSDLQVAHTFVDGDIVSADNFNTNYSDIVTYVNNHNSGSSTWDSFYVTHETNVPCTVNNSSGTQDIVNFKDNGTSVLTINDGGIINMPYQDFSKAVLGTVLGQNFADGSTTQVSSGLSASVLSQTQSSMNSTTGKFTAAAGGYYYVLVRGQVTAGSLSGTVSFSLYKNGSQYSKLSKAVTQLIGHPEFFDVVSMAANDYLEIYLINNSGTTISFGPSAFEWATSFAPFFVYKLS